MKTLEQLKSELDAANSLLVKETRKAMRSGRGPSAEMATAKKAAMVCYHVWEAELTRRGK